MGKVSTVAALSIVFIYLNVIGCMSLKIGGYCFNEDGCYDIRLHCINSTCLCSRFYFWDDEIDECNLNITELRIWLSGLREEIDLSEKLNSEAVSLFYHLGFAGVLAMTLGFVGGVSCVIFFCILKPDGKTEYESQGKGGGEKEDPGATFIPPAVAFEMIV